MSSIDVEKGSESSPVARWLALLSRERTLLADLATALARQRDAVAHDRAVEVNQSADDMQRLLHALEGSRRRSAEFAAQLPAGAEPPAEVRAAIGELHRAAAVVRREAAINRDVLRHCIAAGEAFLQELFSSLESTPAYGPRERREEPAESGRLLDRRG